MEMIKIVVKPRLDEKHKDVKLITFHSHLFFIKHKKNAFHDCNDYKTYFI